MIRTGVRRRFVSAAALLAACLASPPPAAAHEEGDEGGEHGDHAKWSKFSVAAGLQMWRPVFATDAGDLVDPPLIGLVVKPHMTLTGPLGVHLRGAYGINSFDTPNLDRSMSGWAVGVGLDTFFALGDRVLWYNTMGLAFQQTRLKESGADHPTTNNPGAYFITTLDVTMMGSMGMWMDWGCQVVGPVFADSAAGKVSAWHINPLGAGGFRFSF